MSGIYIPHKGDVEGAVYMVAVVGGKARLYTYRYGEPNMVYIKDGIIVHNHGRLVDADDMILNWRNEINTLNERGVVYANGYWDEIIEQFIQDAVTAPTIIPADKEGDGC